LQGSNQGFLGILNKRQSCQAPNQESLLYQHGGLFRQGSGLGSKGSKRAFSADVATMDTQRA
jgi:hypothetical protein